MIAVNPAVMVPTDDLELKDTPVMPGVLDVLELLESLVEVQPGPGEKPVDVV